MEDRGLATRQDAVLEKVVIEGDLKQLTSAERVAYYRRVCESLGLNPLTKPFDYITLNGRLTLYARKDATDQLRGKANVSITKLERELVSGVYVVTAYANNAGRQDSSIGAVSVDGLKGDALANAMMKAETKAKRRVTLSIVGLGMLDETEVETIADSRPVAVNMETGEITAPKPATPPHVQAALTANAAKLAGPVAQGEPAAPASPSPLAGRASPALWQAYNKLEHAALDWNNGHPNDAVVLPELHDKSTHDEVTGAGVKLKAELEAAKLREAEAALA